MAQLSAARAVLSAAHCECGDHEYRCSQAPGRFCDYVRFPFVADGERARRELGFAPRHASRDALMSYLAYRHPHTRLSAAAAPA